MITPERRLEMRAQKIERIRAASFDGPPGIGLTLEQQTAYAVLALVAAEQARDEERPGPSTHRAVGRGNDAKLIGG